MNITSPALRPRYAGLVPNEWKETGTNEERQLRLLIQQVQTGSGKLWRLIVYGDGERYPAPEFASFEALLAVLQRHVPDLDPANVPVPADSPGGSIAYAADVVLTNEQRTALGLIPVSPGRPAPFATRP